MSTNVFFHAFCSGCGTEVADNGNSTVFNCDSCRSVSVNITTNIKNTDETSLEIKEPESRIDIVISNPPINEHVAVTVSDALTDDEEWEEKQRILRVLDEIEEARRRSEWADYGDEEDHYMCQCDNCAGYYDDDDGYEDDGYGLDWNESGYFD